MESPDYRKYLANLRATGCPEKTVRGIIVADVNEQFATAMVAVTKTNQYQFWRKEPVIRSEEQANELQHLLAQKREVLRTLGFDALDFAGVLGEVFRDKIEEFDLQQLLGPDRFQLYIGGLELLGYSK